MEFNKQYNMWLPSNTSTIEPVTATIEDLIPPPQEPEPPKVEEKPYRYEVDEDGVDWYICNECGKKYNGEPYQKRHQTTKHKGVRE